VLAAELRLEEASGEKRKQQNTDALAEQWGVGPCGGEGGLIARCL
jgi:hypothetical protein